MPKAFDRRIPANDHDPLAGLLDFSNLDGVIEQSGDMIRNAVTNIIKQFTGLDLSSPEAFVASLIEVITTGGPAAEFATAILNMISGAIGIGPVENVLPKLVAALQGIDLDGDPGAILRAITDAAGAFIGAIRSALMQNVPIGSIADIQPNMLLEGGFDTADTISAASDFNWDGTDGHTTDPLGCAVVTADGADHVQVSDLIEVSQGQKLEISARVKWVSITATAAANAIRLELIPYTSSGPQTPVMVGSVASPTGSSGGTNGWGTEIGDDYTVPAGVVAVVVQCRVTAAATAGTVKFDDVTVIKTQKLALALVEGLQTALDSIANDIGDAFDALATKLGISEWDDWVADEWQQLLNGVKGSTGGVIGDLIDRLQHLNSSGQFDGGQIIGTIAQSVVENLEDDLADAGDAIADARDKLQDTWNKVVGGYRRTTVTGQTSTDVEEVMISVGQEILVAQESTITLANQANAPRNVPFWVSPNRFEEVSFPRALLQPVPSIGSGGSGTTGTGSGLTVLDANWNAEERDAVRSHTHSTPSHSHALSYVKPTFTIPAGTLALTAITMTQDRLINVARFLAGGGTPPSTALYIGLYSIDPTTGTMTLVYDYGDQKGNINTGSDLYETALNLPADMLADAGAMFAIGILPVGASFAVAGVRRQPIVTASVIYPVAATELVSGQSSLPTTVDNSSMDHTSTHRVWVSLGQAVETIPEDTSPVTLTMTFNVANTSAWSSPSFQQYGNASSNFTVQDGNIYAGGPTVLFGDVTYVRSALCLTPVHTNDHMAEITLGTGWDDDAYGYAADRAYVRCNSAGTSGVCLHVDATGGAVRVRIATISNLTSTGTVRTTVSGIPYAVGDRYSIRAVGNVYTAYRNDEPIPGATWTDSGNIVPVGKAWRRTAFGSGSRCTNGYSHYEPAHIDSFKAADLAA